MIKMEALHHSLSNKIRLSFAWELKFEKGFFCYLLEQLQLLQLIITNHYDLFLTHNDFSLAQKKQL